VATQVVLILSWRGYIIAIYFMGIGGSVIAGFLVHHESLVCFLLSLEYSYDLNSWKLEDLALQYSFEIKFLDATKSSYYYSKHKVKCESGYV
jgi:hypothetical protein